MSVRQAGRKRSAWPLTAYLAALAVFTAYVLLDAFVIARRYSAAAPDAFPQTGENAQLRDEPVITENGYSDGLVSVEISSMRAYDSTVYVADIRMADVYHLKTALAENTYGRNVTQRVAEMAQAHQAILAVNGDYYGARKSGYVVRNGVLYRENAQSASQEDLCIWPDGTMTIIREGEISAQALVEAGVLQVFSFGPSLLLEGEITVGESQEVGKAMISNPRTAIAMIEPLHYLFVVAEGRTEESEGLSLYQLAKFLQTLGAQLAYNLDGGGSSTLVFLDEVINYPTTNGKYQERAVSDIVYIQ